MGGGSHAPPWEVGMGERVWKKKRGGVDLEVREGVWKAWDGGVRETFFGSKGFINLGIT